MNGKIKYYNFDKGYGFISSESGEDIFFHITDVDISPEALVKGARCSFEKECYTAKDGLAKIKAVNVQIM